MRIMRNIRYITGILVLAFCACTNEAIDVNSPVEEKMVTVRLSTGPDDSDPETRTFLNSDKTIAWEEDDAVMFVGTDVVSRLVNIEPTGPTAVFEGTVPESAINYDNSPDRGIQFVLYPYSLNTGAKVKKVNASGVMKVENIVLPNRQELIPGTFGQGYNMSLATFRWNTQTIHFRNLCGLLRVNLKGEVEVKSVEIAAPEYINGTFTVKRESEFGPRAVFTSALQENAGENPQRSKKAVLEAETPIMLTDQVQSFYATVLPYQTTGEYTITVTTADDETFERKVTLDKGVDAGKILTLDVPEIKYDISRIDGSVVDIDLTSAELGYRGAKPDVSEKPEWVDIDITDDKVIFTADVFFGAEGRTGEVVLTDGTHTAAITIRQSPVPAFASMELQFEKEGGSKDIQMTEHLMAYLADHPGETCEATPSASWITAVVTSTGLTVTVGENNDHARDASIDVKAGGELVARLAVSQANPSDYSRYIGEYELVFKGGPADKEAVKDNLTAKFTVTALEDGVSYKAVFESKYTSGITCNYAMVLLYNKYSGSNPISLICPQLINESWPVHSAFASCWIRAAKEPVTEGFRLLPDSDNSEVDVTVEGAGFNLRLDEADGTVKFDFVPNKIAQEEGVTGIWFHGIRSTGKDIIKDWIRPVSGRDYIRINKK